MDPTVTVFVRGLITVICFILIAVDCVMLRRTRRGEKAFTDQDWRLLFGKPKADVLTARYGGKLGLLFVACALVGLLVLMPFGGNWYVLGVVLTAVVIVLSHPRRFIEIPRQSVPAAVVKKRVELIRVVQCECGQRAAP